MDVRTVFHRYDLSPGASPEQIRQAVAVKRGWAQAQWTNAKWREQALWVLQSHQRHLERMLAWQPPVGPGYPRRSLDTLDSFIRGCALARLPDAQLLRLAAKHAEDDGLPADLGRRRAAQLLGIDPATVERLRSEDAEKVVEFDDEPSVVLG